MELTEDEDHVCDEDTKKTIKMLKRDSKPCPKCSSVIHKIDGCDQMWCPDCQTAFSWKKGTIETRVHNPHYYEYLRNTQGHVPREPEDVPEGEAACGGFLTPEDNQLLLGRFEYQHDGTRRHTTYSKVWRVLIHADEWTRRRWNIPDDTERKQLLWRVQYLIGDLSEDAWKRKLQIQDKDLRKKAEIRNVIDTYIQLGCDIIRDMTNGNLDLDEKVERHAKLAKYFDGVFDKISTQYGCVTPHFTENYLNIETLKR